MNFARIFLVLCSLVISLNAGATTTSIISNNVNGMRQLSSANIVQRGPGTAPYYGPSSCSQELPGYQTTMGSGYNCACPDGAANPVCTPICSALLPVYQQKAGSLYNCSCPASDQVPSCTQLNCGGLLSTYSAEFPSPQYTCSCPSGYTSEVAPTCQSTQTCQSQLPLATASAGANYSCTCPASYGSTDPNTYAQPSCVYVPPTCGDQLAQYQAQYGSNFVCSCPNGTGSIDSPVCTQTCGSQLASYQAQYGSTYSCTCPNGPSSGSTPVCSVITCGSQLAAYQSQYGNGYSCTCPSGNSNAGTPSCSPTCKPPQWWTDVFAGSSGQYVWPIEYYNWLHINSGHVIQPVDISGEGYGSGQSVTVPSPNGWVFDPHPGMSNAMGGIWVAPLYGSSTDYANAHNPTGWVTILNDQQTYYARYGSSSTTQSYYYVVNGNGFNPSITVGGNVLSMGGPQGVTPGLSGVGCGNNYTGSVCYQGSTTPSFSTPPSPPACS